MVGGGGGGDQSTFEPGHPPGGVQCVKCVKVCLIYDVDPRFSTDQKHNWNIDGFTLAFPLASSFYHRR